MPEIALAKVTPDRRSKVRVCSRAGSHRPGRGDDTAQVAAGSTCVVFGAGMVGLAR